MRIESEIGYWNDGYLTFNPEKIRGLFFESFPEAVFDKTNHSRAYIENFFEVMKQKKYEPPDFVVDGYWDKAFQHGPKYIFEVPINKKWTIIAKFERLRITFETDFDFDEALELRIIEFLKLLKYGKIIADRQTTNFIEAVENRGYWKLNDEKINAI